MQNRAYLSFLMSAFLLGCHGRGPVGSEADAVYVAAYGYLIQYRTHFFPVAVDQVCLDGPDARRMVWRMRGSYMRVRADCPYTTPGYVPAERSQDSVAVIHLARGDSGPTWYDFFRGTPTRIWISAGTKRESYAAMLWRVLRARPVEVEATVRYADARVQSADFDCILYRRSRGWGIEQCRLYDVKWRGHAAPEMDDVRGCWHLAWEPLHEEATAGLPTAVNLSTEPDTIDAPSEEYRVTTTPGAADTTSDLWQMARGVGRWRWRLDDGQFVWLGSGYMFEGVNVVLVLDPESGGVRGVAVHWDDMGRPSLTDPMWQVEGRRAPCRKGGLALARVHARR